MPRTALRFPYVAVVLGLSLALGGCVVAPPDYYGGGYYGDGYVAEAPPAPRVEYYGAAPYPGYIWIGGYWHWGAGRYLWTPGHWAAPRPGYNWQPRRWVHEGRGWRMEGGRWDRDDRHRDGDRHRDRD
jgi:hypothetical protein